MPRVPHARAKLAEFFVAIDDLALEGLLRGRVVATVVEGDPVPTKLGGSADFCPGEC